jgi:hypothetical protein
VSAAHDEYLIQDSQCRFSEVMLWLAHIIVKGLQHVSDR